MTYPTCAVTCTFAAASGAPLAGAKVTAALSHLDVAADLGYIVPGVVEATTDQNGQCVLALWPNALGSTASRWRIKVRAEGGAHQDIAAVVPDQPSANLQTIANLPAYPGKTDGDLAVEVAVAAAAEAESSATAAELALDTTVAAAVAAQEAAGAAGEAATAAGNAQAAIDALVAGLEFPAVAIATAISEVPEKEEPHNNDSVGGIDSEAENALTRWTWANIKAWLTTHYSSLYQVILESGTNIKTVNGSSLLGSGDLSVGSSFDPASPGTLGGTTPGVVRASSVAVVGSQTTLEFDASSYSQKVGLIVGGGSFGAISDNNGLCIAESRGVSFSNEGVTSTPTVGLSYYSSGTARVDSGSKYSPELRDLRLRDIIVTGKISFPGLMNLDPVTLPDQLLFEAGGYRLSIGSGGPSAASYNLAVYAGGPTRVTLGTESDDVATIKQTGTDNFRDLKLRNLIATGLVKFPHYTTATRPAWSNGDVIFDDDLDKLVVGGAAGWETVTSV